MALIGNQTGETGVYRGLSSGEARGISITMTEAGTAVSAFANIGASLSGDTWQIGIYTPAGSLIDSTNPLTGVSGGHSWREFTGLTASLSASTEYILMIGVNAAVFDGLSYAASDTYDGRFIETGFTIDPLSSSLTIVTASSQDYQIYLNYTATGGPPVTDGPKLHVVRSNWRLS